MPRYVRVEDALSRLQVDLAFLHRLAEEELIELKQGAEDELVLSVSDVDRVRIALVLTRELDVNLAGVEVIVHMREAMLDMQRQFGDVLDAVVEEVRRRAGR